MLRLKVSLEDQILTQLSNRQSNRLYKPRDLEIHRIPHLITPLKHQHPVILCSLIQGLAIRPLGRSLLQDPHPVTARMAHREPTLLLTDLSGPSGDKP